MKIKKRETNNLRTENLKTLGQLVKEEDGMGTVEVILIIVGILPP